jgi:replication factor A1
MIYTINGLTEDARGVTIRVRVLSKDQPRVVKTKDGEEHRVVDIEVGDRTGRTFLSLWDERVDLLDEGDLVDIENGYVNKFKGRLRLNVGRFGKLEKVEDPSFPRGEELAATRWRGSYRRK